MYSELCLSGNFIASLTEVENMNFLKVFRLLQRSIAFVCRSVSFIDLKSMVRFLLYRMMVGLIPERVFVSKDQLIVQELLFNRRYKTDIEDNVGRYFVKGILEFLRETENREGHVIELGSYKAATSVAIGRFLKNTNSSKKLYACDTFCGHPYDDDYGQDLKGRFNDSNLEYVRAKLARFAVDNFVIPIPGTFEETLSVQIGNHRFSFAFLDCDLYQSGVVALNFLSGRMDTDSIIAIHDYANPVFGISRAVHEFCARVGNKVNLFPIPHLRMK